jgi:hypothetical protein
MIIQVPSKKDIIYKQYLTLLNPILGKNKLTSTEIEVFSRLLLIKSMYSNLNIEVLKTLIFHADTKKRIRQSILEDSKIILSEASFNNIIYSLRKKNFIKDNEITYNTPAIENGSIEVTFKLVLQDDTK